MMRLSTFSTLMLIILLLSGTQGTYAADVLVSSLIDTPDPAVRGGEINYETQVQNQSNDTASNVVMIFDIPATTTFVSVDNGACSHAGGTVTCSYGNMLGTAAVPAGPIETANIVIRSSGATGNTINVSATATTPGDTNTSNDTNTQNTTIGDGADLTTTLIASPDPVTAGGHVTYTATVSNNGANNASSIQIAFDLSVNLTYVSGSANGSGWSCTVSGQTVTCTRSSLNNGSSAPNITFQAKVTGAQTGTITSTATVSAATSDPVPNNNVITADVVVNTGTDVAVTITTASTDVIALSNFSMTLRPRNLGPFDADNVQVDYSVPAGFIINGTPSGTGWSCLVAGQDISCTRGAYSVGATDNISVDLTAPSPASPSNFSHPTDISTTTAEAAEVLANNMDAINITVNPDGADLSITKSKSPNPVAQNSNISSTIRVRNNGPRDAAIGTISVQDTLQAGEVFVSDSGTNWNCIDNTPNIDCTYNAVLNNGSQTPNLTITTVATGTGVLSNTADVSYSGNPPDYDLSNNSVSKTVTSTDAGSASADLVVIKLVDADNTDGDINVLAVDENSIIYTINIQNNGPSAVTGITMTDAIPGFSNGSSGTTGVSISSNASGYTCTTGSSVSCTQNVSLASGATDTIEITVTRPLFDGGKTNRASAFSSVNGDPNRNNNTGAVGVTIAAVADIEVQNKAVTPNPVKSGVEATYTISIKNNGPSTAQNVVVTDTFNLPPGDTGFTFVSASASGGGNCSGLTPNQSYTSVDNPVLTCDNWANISNGSTETITLKIRPNFDASANGRIFQNMVNATTTTFESDNNNNNFGPVSLTVNSDTIDLLINNGDSPFDPVAWDPASSGDNVNNDVVYDVEFINNGPSYATGVKFIYTMQPKAGKTLRFDCDEASPADACGTSADTCTIQSGSNPVIGPNILTLSCSATTVSGKTDEMTANSTGHRYLHFRVITKPDTDGDTHQTNATISANEAETNLANNAEAENTSARGRVDLEIVSKTPTLASTLIDQPFVWDITVTNNGPVDSDQTDVTDTLPAGMVFKGATPTWSNTTDSSSGTCVITGNKLDCDLGSMSVAANAVIKIPVLVDTFTIANVQNCATATTNGVDVTPANNTNVCGTVTVTNSFFPSDFGDAPDTSSGTGTGDYATTLDNGGARHTLPGGTWLGSCVDSDGDGSLQDISASADDNNAGSVQAGTCAGNDDEDGITLPPALIAGQNVDLGIIITGSSCALDGWVDYNADGDFDDVDEQVFTALSLAVGNHTESIAVPAGITVGNSYARFRCSAAGGLTSVETTIGGEVEDYLVSLQPDSGAGTSPTDYGDAPDTAIGSSSGDYKTLAVDDGASHVLGIANAPYLGSCVDSDVETQQDVEAKADDLAAAGGVTVPVTTGTCATAGDDEDGVVLLSLLQAGIAANIDVTSSVGTNDCMLNGWIDFNADGDFADAGEQITNDLNIVSGTTSNLNPVVPVSAVIGTTYARFRCSSTGGLSSIGAAADGEVEDYRVGIQPNLATTAVDFGDAPDTSSGTATGDYSTVEANSGPSHVLGVANAPYLGSCVDSDDGTAQHSDANADDLAIMLGGTPVTTGTCAIAADDEDGVVLVNKLQQGAVANVDVTSSIGTDACILNAWIDFNADGDFLDTDEQIASDLSIASGATSRLTPRVPSAAVVGSTYARFRCNSTGGLSPTDAAADGEVEDYRVTILQRATPIPTLSQWSIMLLMLLVAWTVHTRLGMRKHG